MANCEICGKPSGYFPLCRNCNVLKEKGEIVKCDKCGEWHKKNEPCACKPNSIDIDKQTKKVEKCIICGDESPNGPQCKACYYEMKEYKQQIDRNATLKELSSYYYNLNGNIYRMSDFNKVKSNCNKLFAIATLTKELYYSDTFVNKVQNDITKIIEKKKLKEEKIISKIDQKQDSQQENINYTADGHAVKSLGEKIIDDILYNNGINHAYSPTVPEIDITEEQSIEADWFIPVVNSAKGIYVEYWGMNTPKYLENKERKRKQYKEHNIPLIEIEKDEPLENSDILRVRIMREIKSLAKEHFKYEWSLR